MKLKVFELTETGDILLDGLAQPTPLYGKEAAEQMIIAGIALWRGNWFADPLRGVPWLRIMKKLYSRSDIIQVFTEAILKISIVDEVLDLFIKVGDEVNPDNRRIAQMTYLIVVNGERVNGEIQI